ICRFRLPPFQGRPHMSQQGAYGEQLRQSFRLPHAPTLVTRKLQKNLIAVTHARCESADHGMTKPVPREDAFHAAVQLDECRSRDLWLDGKPFRTESLKPEDVVFQNLQQVSTLNFHSPFNMLIFYLPRAVLDSIADDSNAARIAELRFTPGIGVQDRT